MPNTKSAAKRLRQERKRRLRNRYYLIGARKEMKAFLQIKDKEEAEKRLPYLYSILDKLAKRGIKHKNTVARYKRRMAQHVLKLGGTPS